MTANAAAIQWARVAPGTVVVATDERAWLHRPAGPGDPFSEEMSGPATIASTRRLLDGALEAGKRAAGPAPPSPPLTAIRWAFRLAFQYHTAHPSPRILSEAGARFRELGRPDLAESCAQKAREETGHDELALRDLRGLGYPAEEVVRAIRPPTSAALVEYFAGVVRSETPVRTFGYAYALERPAMSVGRAEVDAVEAILPRGVKATRCLRVHSSVGSDNAHVAEALEVITRLPATERAQVARACYETTLIIWTPRDGDDPPEPELMDLMATFNAPAGWGGPSEPPDTPGVAVQCGERRRRE